MTNEDVKELGKKGLINKVYYEDYPMVNLSGDICDSEGVLVVCTDNKHVELNLPLNDILDDLYIEEEDYEIGINNYLDEVDEDVKRNLIKKFELKEDVKMDITVGVRVCN